MAEVVGELAGKASLVTGAGVGIGRAIAMKLASEGARVLVVDFNEETAHQTASDIVSAGGQAEAFVADVSDEARVASMVQAAVDHFGALDIACNSAAVSRGSGPIHTFDKAVFDQTLDLCLTNTFLCMKHEIEPCSRRNPRKHCQYFFKRSLRGQPYNTAYAAAKSGVNLLTKSSASEYGHKGIRINAVSPGVPARRASRNTLKSNPRSPRASSRPPLCAVWVNPQRLRGVCFLASDRASFITGSCSVMVGLR